jgi:hypothetical protein
MSAQFETESADATQVTRHDADGGGHVRGEGLRARREQRRERDEGAAAGDPVGDTGADTGEQIDRESPSQWKGGDDHWPTLMKCPK